mmetsp:Transcript_138978/g.443778  ORF Transcript_138978/g.443778 Transcript_138978/m.443778 type:complete len:388 (+) Transcript_138978:92-1255(+)
MGQTVSGSDVLVPQERNSDGTAARAAGSTEAAAPRRPLEVSAPASGWGPESDGRWRWAVRADTWRPVGGEHGQEFQFLLGLVPEGPERDGIFRSPRWADRKSALLGRLLARRACARALGLDGLVGFVVAKTHGGKPFLRAPLPNHMPNFNFNVSHDGHWVVLASDPLHVVGCDVSAPQRVRGDAEDDAWIQELSNLLHQGELDAIHQEPTVRKRYAVFQRLWSAKEAVTKGIGQGIVFGVARIEVDLGRAKPLVDLGGVADWLRSWWHQEKGEDPKEVEQAQTSELDPDACGRTEPFVYIDMWPRSDWRIAQQPLAEDHWVSVALGPVEEVVDQNGDFLRTLRLRNLSQEQAAFGREPHFEELSVMSLVPASLQPEYAATLGCSDFP